MDRSLALDRVEDVLNTIETEVMPVPVRELWVYGDVALGLDPINRLNVYVKKEMLFHDQDSDAGTTEQHQVKGIGTTVRAAWAEHFPEHIRVNTNGYAAPEKCLGAHLLREDEPVHLEVCNAGFEDNVIQRIRGAEARKSYEELLDPRGVCLWIEGKRSETAFEKLRSGELVFPTLPRALSMLGMDQTSAGKAAKIMKEYTSSQTGTTIRGQVL